VQLKSLDAENIGKAALASIRNLQSAFGFSLWYGNCFGVGFKRTDRMGGIRKMPINGIFSNTISLLERSLDLRSLNHRVLASNIANRIIKPLNWLLPKK